MKLHEPPTSERPPEHLLIDVVLHAGRSQTGPEQKPTAAANDASCLLLVHGTLLWSDVVEALAIHEERDRCGPERKVPDVGPKTKRTLEDARVARWMADADESTPTAKKPMSAR
jgi:hypothetical protein